MIKKGVFFVAVLALLFVFLSGCTNPPICGNGVCEPGEIQTCPGDCGFEPEPTGWVEFRILDSQTKEPVSYGQITMCPAKEPGPIPLGEKTAEEIPLPVVGEGETDPIEIEIDVCTMHNFKNGFASIAKTSGTYRAEIRAEGYIKTYGYPIYIHPAHATKHVVYMKSEEGPSPLTGTLEVTVMDCNTNDSNSIVKYVYPLEGAKVELSQEESYTAWGKELYTDEKGNASFTGLKYGNYNLAVSKTGYSALVTIGGINLNQPLLHKSYCLSKVGTGGGTNGNGSKEIPVME